MRIIILCIYSQWNFFYYIFVAVAFAAFVFCNSLFVSVSLISRFMIGQYVTVHGDVISHVNITHVMVEDGGEYSCVAENRAGKLTHSARLNVYGMFPFFVVFFFK